jgi:hypothetical protein
MEKSHSSNAGARENAGPASRAEAIDEYRELTLLAGAWERQALTPGAGQGVSERACARIDDVEGKPAPR